MVTKVQINTLVAIITLAIISVLLILHGDTCAAVGLAGSIGVVAVHFAQRGNENGHRENQG